MAGGEGGEANVGRVLSGWRGGGCVPANGSFFRISFLSSGMVFSLSAGWEVIPLEISAFGFWILSSAGFPFICGLAAAQPMVPTVKNKMRTPIHGRLIIFILQGLLSGY